ncbi:MAG: type 1 glutamine amidotransferase [Verrucomicrobiota bacterium]
MRIHYLQHMGCEGTGKIAGWISEHGHAVSSTHLYRGEKLPDNDAFDFLVIMGGPMNIYEYRNHPWLPEEKQFIRRAIDSGKLVLGVCLGAQLIADVLGAKIYQNAKMEIGWYPVRFNDAKKTVRGFEDFPDELTVLHWHGDTFDLPEGALRLAESDACRNQAFAFGQRVIGLQFHIEMDEPDVAAFLDDILPEPVPGQIQSAEQIREGNKYLPEIHAALYRMLDALTATTT